MEALLDEVLAIRDVLVDAGNDESVPLISSLENLMDAMNRHDPDEIERQISELEQRLTGPQDFLSETSAPVRLTLLDGTEIPEAARRRIPDVETVLRRLERAKNFLRNLGRGGAQKRQPTPDKPNEDGVIIPKPPSVEIKVRQPSDQKRGIGDNQPPSELEDENDAPNSVQEVELSPGVMVRGDPTSNRWANFKSKLSRLSATSRNAANSLVNGGELTTLPGTHGSISNITRKGGLAESIEAYEEAVRRAGGDPKRVPIQQAGDNVVRTFQNLDDGTRFVHRVTRLTGKPTVDVQILRRAETGAPIRAIDQTIKIRFE
jgi:hypothetical protein